MYVRWKRRETSPPGWERWTTTAGTPKPVLLIAVLVESRRVDGTPRQRHVAYLGSIRQDRLERREGWAVRRFWETAAAALDALALPPAERAPLVATLAKTVPPPTPEEVAEGARELAALEARLARHR